MREIKFRAKRVDNNEWIYGSLITDSHLKDEYGEYYDARIVPWPQPAMPYNWYRVHVKTIGEFTGQKDITGNEIYEGDMLADKWKVEVYKHKNNGAWMVKFHNNPKMNKVKTLYEYLKSRELAGTSADDNLIIGNTHETTIAI